MESAEKLCEEEGKGEEEPVRLISEGGIGWMLLGLRACKQSWDKGRRELSELPEEHETMAGAPS